MDKQDSVLLRIKVQPRSSQQKIVKTASGVFKAWVRSAPEKGQANREVLSLLAEYLAVPPSLLKIVRGHGDRHKVIRVDRGILG